MSYVNPLHTPVSAASRSQFSSLGGAVNSAPASSQFLSPNRRRLPQAPYTGSTKSRSSGRASQPITFDYVGHSGQGIPMGELITRGGHTLASMVHAAGDQVLVHTGLARINLHISVNIAYFVIQGPILISFCFSGQDMNMSIGLSPLRSTLMDPWRALN